MVLILVTFIIYFLQLNFFSWFTIDGVKPNLFIILVLFIGLFTSKNLGAIYGMVIGIILDLLTAQKIGFNALILGAVGLLAEIFDKNFSKDNKMTIIVIVSITTIIAETTVYILNYVFLNLNIDMFAFIKILLIETMYNIILSIILYPLIQKQNTNKIFLRR